MEEEMWLPRHSSDMAFTEFQGSPLLTRQVLKQRGPVLTLFVALEMAQHRPELAGAPNMLVEL